MSSNHFFYIFLGPASHLWCPRCFQAQGLESWRNCRLCLPRVPAYLASEALPWRKNVDWLGACSSHPLCIQHVVVYSLSPFQSMKVQVGGPKISWTPQLCLRQWCHYWRLWGGPAKLWRGHPNRLGTAGYWWTVALSYWMFQTMMGPQRRRNGSKGWYFFPNSKTYAMGSLAQISSGAIQVPGKAPEGSGADTCWGSGGFRCRYLVRFWRFQVLEVSVQRVSEQIHCEVLEGSDADTWWGSGRFRCR